MSPDHTPPKIAVVGAGAIGMLIYHQLAAFTTPLLLGRNFTLTTEDNQTEQLTVESLSDKPLAPETQACLINNLDSVTELQLATIELVIVCVKSYQVATAIAPLIKKLPSNTSLLLLHNGMGPHLQVIDVLQKQRRNDINLYLGTTSQAALKVSSLHVRQTGTGKTVIGQFQGSTLAPNLLSLLLAAIPNSQLSFNILLALWQKLIVNCAINPLTAIEQCNNGQLAQPQYQEHINAIAKECVDVAQADGIKLSLADSVATINKVIQLTANNFSSMHQDVKHQRMTEIKQINGFVGERALKHHISTPVNDALTAKVNQISAD
ncbi:2-dehydropantoate 2-reductase [Shewanella olleyana]|uniref:ketopantoate reductase family protein n=1 Tax=Shewanella olleyana TaxID=135626 RepID=UPI00200BAD9D|nr:2-dehydropantoate 2-reductase [Shewanella olleyana]MCL1068136.1 2-dehydropantoate 2-reductase [Shewanella olleyana]